MWSFVGDKGTVWWAWVEMYAETRGAAAMIIGTFSGSLGL
jgi:hypothetical protein